MRGWSGSTFRLRVRACLLVMAALVAATVPVWANSAEPPALIIIVPNPPEGLTLTLEGEKGALPAKVTSRLIESYYTFYNRELPEAGNPVLNVIGPEGAYSLSIPRPQNTYNTVFTLDIAGRVLTPGELPLRTALLVLVRVGLTLLLEGAVFWLAGYRTRFSWQVFLGMNLLTQGVLNLWISGFVPVGGYTVLALIFGEFFVFTAEIAAFLALLREKGRLRAALTALTANSLSLIAGGFLITVLPL